MKIEKYYDICCTRCGFYRSTDFYKGMETNMRAETFRKLIKTEGWREIDGETLCPVCAVEVSQLKRRNEEVEQ